MAGRYGGDVCQIEKGWRLVGRVIKHQTNAELFWNGLAEMGLECLVPYKYRLPSLTTVRVPDGVDVKAVAGQLLREYNIEIAGGFGPLAGQIWRVGLMGFNSRPENVMLLLAALKNWCKSCCFCWQR